VRREDRCVGRLPRTPYPHIFSFFFLFSFYLKLNAFHFDSFLFRHFCRLRLGQVSYSGGRDVKRVIGVVSSVLKVEVDVASSCGVGSADSIVGTEWGLHPLVSVAIYSWLRLSSVVSFEVGLIEVWCRSRRVMLSSNLFIKRIQKV